jgi:hypothetical protein
MVCALRQVLFKIAHNGLRTASPSKDSAQWFAHCGKSVHWPHLLVPSACAGGIRPHWSRSHPWQPSRRCTRVSWCAAPCFFPRSNDKTPPVERSPRQAEGHTRCPSAIPQDGTSSSASCCGPASRPTGTAGVVATRHSRRCRWPLLDSRVGPTGRRASCRRSGWSCST